MKQNNPPKKKIAFICVHNSCRSQIAESLAKHFRGDEFDFYSAGTETKPKINQDAVRLVKKLYGIAMEQTQYSKLISDIPSVDVAISMGCNVSCPYIGKDFDDNWLPRLSGYFSIYFFVADKEVSIDELGSAEIVKLEDKLVVQQDGVAKQVSFDTVDDLLTYVKEVVQTTTGSGDGGTNIITMTLSNGSTVDFSIKNVVSLSEKGRLFYF